jgi:hypothetical protein
MRNRYSNFTKHTAIAPPPGASRPPIHTAAPLDGNRARPSPIWHYRAPKPDSSPGHLRRVLHGRAAITDQDAPPAVSIWHGARFPNFLARLARHAAVSISPILLFAAWLLFAAFLLLPSGRPAPPAAGRN